MSIEAGSLILNASFSGLNMRLMDEAGRKAKVACSEEKILETLIHYSCVLIFDIVVSRSFAQANIEALCSQTFAKRFSYGGIASFIVIPTLAYLSALFEAADLEIAKNLVDNVYFGIPDVILVANIVQLAVAVYFGISILQNSIFLSCYLLSFLEQGILASKSEPNQGILYKAFEGKIVDWYKKPLATFHQCVITTDLLVNRGTAGKVIATAMGIHKLSEFVDFSRVYPLWLKSLMELNERANDQLNNPDVTADEINQVLREYMTKQFEAVKDKNFVAFSILEAQVFLKLSAWEKKKKDLPEIKIDEFKALFYPQEG